VWRFGRHRCRPGSLIGVLKPQDAPLRHGGKDAKDVVETVKPANVVHVVEALADDGWFIHGVFAWLLDLHGTHSSSVDKDRPHLTFSSKGAELTVEANVAVWAENALDGPGDVLHYQANKRHNISLGPVCQPRCSGEVSPNTIGEFTSQLQTDALDQACRLLVSWDSSKFAPSDTSSAISEAAATTGACWLSLETEVPDSELTPTGSIGGIP